MPLNITRIIIVRDIMVEVILIPLIAFYANSRKNHLESPFN